jgi:uncharacterized protein (DUF488 family)
MTPALYTIGHSTHEIDKLISLLRLHHIDVLADVRSNPYSRMNPQFNREGLKESLRASRLRYVFLGKELGGRSNDPACYLNGKVQYERVAQTEPFRQGLERLFNGMEEHRIALMCAEKDPLFCHRAILVGRKLHDQGLSVLHILEDGRIETHAEALVRLLRLVQLPHTDLFCTHEQMIEKAYALQAERIAYQNDATAKSSSGAT